MSGERRPNVLRSVAEEIGVSLGTVSNRLKRLEDTKIIKGYRLVDPDKIDWGLTVVDDED